MARVGKRVITRTWLQCVKQTKAGHSGADAENIGLGDDVEGVSIRGVDGVTGPLEEADPLADLKLAGSDLPRRLVQPARADRGHDAHGGLLLSAVREQNPSGGLLLGRVHLYQNSVAEWLDVLDVVDAGVGPGARERARGSEICWGSSDLD